MKLIIDIPEQWHDDMVWENFDKVDELCQAILDGDVIPDNATVCDIEQIRAEIEQNAYPIVHGVNNHEKGMTLYGILQIIDKYTKGE